MEQVLQLQYRVRWLSDDVSVRNDAAPVTVQLAGFNCSLSGETLIAAPSSDCSSVDAARAALEPALHAWEASSELDQGLRFSFKYAGSAVHDVASSQQRAVAIDDVVALSDAVAAVRCRDQQLLGARRQGKAGTSSPGRQPAGLKLSFRGCGRSRYPAASPVERTSGSTAGLPRLRGHWTGRA